MSIPTRSNGKPEISRHRDDLPDPGPALALAHMTHCLHQRFISEDMSGQ